MVGISRLHCYRCFMPARQCSNTCQRPLFLQCLQLFSIAPYTGLGLELGANRVGSTDKGGLADVSAWHSSERCINGCFKVPC